MEYARIKSGYSQLELERTLGIGRGYYRYLKRMGSGMLAGTLLDFCHATHVDMSFIVYGNVEPPPSIQLQAGSIGGRIRELREIHGLSQREFARKIGYDKETANILLWEKNRHAPRLGNLLRIAEAFGIGVGSFF